METKQIEEQIAGLIEKGKGLRKKESLFLRASGIAQTIEKHRMGLADSESELTDMKEKLAELKATKTEAVKVSLIAMQEKITALLPEGEGVVEIDDKFIIGWLLPNKPLVPFEGLSGGQKIVFGQALGNSLLKYEKQRILVYEAAEVDSSNLEKLLIQIVSAREDSQIIVNTWVVPPELSKNWNHIVLNET